MNRNEGDAIRGPAKDIESARECIDKSDTRKSLMHSKESRRIDSLWEDLKRNSECFSGSFLVFGFDAGKYNAIWSIASLVEL